MIENVNNINNNSNSCVVQGGGAPLLSLGGKQLLLATKTGQQQLTSLGHVLLSGDKLGQMVANIGGQQLVLAAPAAGGQQLVVPASALQGGQIAIKGLQGLQAFHTLKVSTLLICV